MSDDLILAEVERVEAVLHKLAAAADALLHAARTDVAWLITAVQAEREEVLRRRADQTPILNAAEQRVREAEAKLRELEQINAVNSTERDRLATEVERLRKGPAGWEEDHQRRALEAAGVSEFSCWGCDAIQHVAEALVASRAERGRLDAQAAALRKALSHLVRQAGAALEGETT